MQVDLKGMAFMQFPSLGYPFPCHPIINIVTYNNTTMNRLFVPFSNDAFFFFMQQFPAIPQRQPFKGNPVHCGISKVYERYKEGISSV